MGKIASRTTVLILITILQTGCLSSSYVASIGARSLCGSQDYQRDSESYQVQVSNFKREVSSMAFVHGAFLPYTNLFNGVDSKAFGVAQFNNTNIEWTNTTEGTLIASIDGRKYSFDVSINCGQLHLKHRYRYWYSYPLQGLLIISMPLDFALDLIALPVILTMSLFDK